MVPCGQWNEKKIKNKEEKMGEKNETQGTAIIMLLNGTLGDNDIQGHSSHKRDDVQLSQRTNNVSDSDDKDNSTRNEDQKNNTRTQNGYHQFHVEIPVHLVVHG
jgi:hypothetical protein